MADDQGGRPQSEKAARLAQNAAGGSAGSGNGIGSGRVLGSSWTDTPGTELSYGVGGRTVLTFYGKEYTFAPVAWDDHDEAALELERLPVTLLAFGMVNPDAAPEDITAQELAGMVKVLAGAVEISEFQACANVAMLFYNLTKEQRAAFARLMWFSFRRHDEEITLDQVKRLLDYSNMPYLLRLYFRKNLGVLDRFLHRLTELMPAVPEKTLADEPTETAPVTLEQLRDYLSVGLQAEEEPQANGIPDDATPEEAANLAIQAALPPTETPTV